MLESTGQATQRIARVVSTNQSVIKSHSLGRPRWHFQPFVCNNSATRTITAGSDALSQCHCAGPALLYWSENLTRRLRLTNPYIQKSD